MDNQFDRFIHFGAIANKAKRKEISEIIFQTLTKKSGTEEKLKNEETDNFATAIKDILGHEKMKEMCQSNPELGEKIGQEILDFINKTKKELNKTESPFELEQQLLNQLKGANPSEFKKHWPAIKNFLQKTYHRRELNSKFYENEFKESLNESGIKKEKPKFESVKEHLLDKWGCLLFKKQSQWEIEEIDKYRKAFCDELYQKIDNLSKVSEILSPFTNELGRLWDNSKGNWQKVNFDLLRHFANLVEKDQSLKELVEMLGRMRAAEREFEEELFTEIQIKPEWKVNNANKSDLIGVKESDDLTSLLPSEIALLADPGLQTIFYKKFAEKKLQTFEHQAKFLSFKEQEVEGKRQKEKEDKKGPFIICVDTSGSMHGHPEMVAKTLCFAILKMAIKEKRKCYLISFSTGIETINLSELNSSLNKLIEFLSMGFHGGTDASPALREALRMLSTQDFKKADIIMVSDFVMPSIDPSIDRQIQLAKENKTKFHSLVIGSGHNATVMKNFDSNWVYNLGNSKSIITLVKDLSKI